MVSTYFFQSINNIYHISLKFLLSFFRPFFSKYYKSVKANNDSVFQENFLIDELNS